MTSSLLYCIKPKINGSLVLLFLSYLFCRIKCVDYRIKVTLIEIGTIGTMNLSITKKKKVLQMPSMNRHASYSFFFCKFCSCITAISILANYFFQLVLH